MDDIKKYHSQTLLFLFHTVCEILFSLSLSVQLYTHAVTADLSPRIDSFMHIWGFCAVCYRSAGVVQ